jgi:hypothetical protein
MIELIEGIGTCLNRYMRSDPLFALTIIDGSLLMSSNTGLDRLEVPSSIAVSFSAFHLSGKGTRRDLAVGILIVNGGGGGV